MVLADCGVMMEPFSEELRRVEGVVVGALGGSDASLGIMVCCCGDWACRARRMGVRKEERELGDAGGVGGWTEGGSRRNFLDLRREDGDASERR